MPPDQILIIGVDCLGHIRIYVKVTSGYTYCDVESENSGYYAAGNCQNYRIYELENLRAGLIIPSGVKKFGHCPNFLD